ncbi:MAG: hypothetical protein M5U28_41710 [Sandaracinaceae bacterium]|nr:hypothetical protein [Sandaracinaceae bacterium]
MVEFYSDGRGLDIAGIFSELIVRDELHFPAQTVEYRLTDLPDGEYTVVHRRSSVPPGVRPLYDDGAPIWRMFEGEPALVTVLVRGGEAADGGM